MDSSAKAFNKLATIWALLMALADVFIIEKIRGWFAPKVKKQIEG